MSSIATLGISGIRAYSPHRQEVIHFEKPVTLILGSNGSGKTTIIECLRAATTGSLPPGTNNGRSFLMDPEVAKQSDVMGSIKLKFVAVNGHPLLAVRTMHIRKRGEKQEFRKLEQFIKSKNPTTGLTVSINYNVNEIDRQIPELFGVSKAILENVVFCHQEDSLWPFRDNATLKTIFDELFETTSFTKTHENLKTIIRDKRKRLKDQKATMDMAKVRYDHVIVEMKRYMNLGKDHEVTLNKLNEQKAKKMQVQAAIMHENIDEKLRLATSNEQLVEYQLRQQFDRLATMETKLGFKSEVILTEEFSLESSIKDVESVGRDLSENQASLQSKIKEMEELQLEADAIRARLNLTDVTEDKNQVKGLLKQINERLHGERSPIRAVKASLLLEAAAENILSHTKDIEALEKDISEIRSEKAEHAIQARNQSENLRYQIDRLHSLLKQKQSNSHEEQLEKLNVRLTIVNQRIQEKEEEILHETGELSLQSTKLDAAFEQLNEIGKLRRLSEVCKSYREFRQIESNLQSAQDSISELCRVCDISEDSELSIVKVEELLKEVQEEEDRQKETISALEKKKIEVEYSISANEVKKEQISERIQQLQKTLSKSLGKDTFNESHRSYEELKAEVKKLDIDISTYKKMREQWFPALVEASNESGQCQLCTQTFGEPLYHSQKEHFLQYTGKVTDHEKDLQKELDHKKAKLEVLKMNKDILLEADKLRQELGTLEKLTENLYLDLGRASNLFSKSRRDSSSVVKRKTNLRDLQVLLDDRQKLEQSLSSIDQSIFKQYSTTDLEKVSNATLPEESSIVTELNYRKSLIKQCEGQLTSFKQQRSELAESKSAIEREMSTLQSQGRDSRSAGSLQEEVENLTQSLTILERDSCSKQSSFAQELQGLEDKCTAMRQVKSNIEYLAKEAQIRLEKIKAIEGDELTASKAGKMNERDFELGHLKTATQRISDLQSSIADLTASVESKGKNLESLKNIVELATAKESVEKLRAELERERENIIALKKRSEKERHAKQILAELNVAVSKLEGIEMTQNAQLMAAYDSIYEQRMVEDTYAKSIFEYECIRTTLQDMEFYSDSVDKALVIYHQEQIAMINKTITKLWKATYKNKDIKKIEIKAEQIVEKATSKSNFNYRVVFYGLDETELEMKGRSSMGQKVLASIVIRIALAQAFGINCGVLALDEPTTNLDKANIESLAQFLSDLIEQQADTELLQLIVITHDDDFIKLFKRYTENYYYVSKDADGWSKIEKRQFEQVPVK